MRDLEAAGISPYYVPVAIFDGSLPYGETFLATGNIIPDPKVLAVRRLMYDWAEGEEAERLSRPVPENVSGPSMVIENTYRWRSLFQGGEPMVSPTLVWMKGSELRVVRGFPVDAEFSRIASDLRPELPDPRPDPAAFPRESFSRLGFEGGAG